jgi:tetratricopeptide (TPR) repeat protein
MTGIDSELRHFTEEIRLLVGRDPIEGLRRWSDLFTKLRQAGQYDLCQELLQVIKGMQFPLYGVGIVRYSEGWLYDRSGQWEEAISAYEAAQAVFMESGLPLAVEVLVQIGSLYQDQGIWEAAEDAYNRAIAIAGEHGDRRGRAMVLNNLGGLWALRNENQRACCYFKEAKDEFTACGDRYNQAAASIGLAGTLRDEGHLKDASDHIVLAMSIFQDLGDAHGIATSVASLALTYHLAGKLYEARHNYLVAMEIFTSINDRAGIAKTLANLALLIQDMRDYDAAVGLLEQAIAEYQEIGDHHGETLAYVNLARLQKIRGDKDGMAAAVASAAAAELSVKHGYPDQQERLCDLGLGDLHLCASLVVIRLTHSTASTPLAAG